MTTLAQLEQERAKFETVCDGLQSSSHIGSVMESYRSLRHSVDEGYASWEKDYAKYQLMLERPQANPLRETYETESLAVLVSKLKDVQNQLDTSLRERDLHPTSTENSLDSVFQLWSDYEALHAVLTSKLTPPPDKTIDTA